MPRRGIARPGEVGDAGRVAHGDAVDVVVAQQFDLAGMEAAPDRDAERRHRLGDRGGAAHGFRGNDAVGRPAVLVAMAAAAPA
jgi:hypothetical protein